MVNEHVEGGVGYTFDSSTITKQHFGGAGLLGSPSSYMTVLRMLLNGGSLNGSRILKPETVDTMFLPHLATPQMQDDLATLGWQIVEPWTRKAEKKSKHVSFGYGGMIGEALPSGRAAGALSWAGFGNIHWVVDRTNDVAFSELVLCSSAASS